MSILKKAFVIGLIALLICIAFTTSINANSIKIPDEEVELKTKENNPYIYDIFLFGKVSNVRKGGYTPAYWFHIDKVMTIGNQIPKVQWLEDCNGHMLSMDFRGFVFKNIILGKVSEIYIEKCSEKEEEKLYPPWGQLIVNVKEIYGTLENPRYRPLQNVTVIFKLSMFGFYYSHYRTLYTDETGKNGVWTPPGLAYKVIISKEGYHAYECKPFKKGIRPGEEYVQVYFTMAEDGSPFTKDIKPSFKPNNIGGVYE